MRIRNRFLTTISSVLFALPLFAADTVPVVDRGLPQANLNNASGTARSNVRWSRDEDGFIGDDFTIGAVGERWVIDSIRVWTVPGSSHGKPAHLGEFYQDIRLYLGSGNKDLTPVSSTQLSAESGESSNPSVRITDATQQGTILYDDFGTMLRIWQVDFTNLNLNIAGGMKQRFGVWGNGREIPGTDGKLHEWFNHASNAALSGSREDGADGEMLEFDPAGRAKNPLQARGNGWDKSADINVQVFAHRVNGRTSVPRSNQ